MRPEAPRRRTWRALAALLGILLAYPAAAVIAGLIPLNRHYAPAIEGVEILLVSNGVHSGLALPVVNEIVDWRVELTAEGDAGSRRTRFVLVGWGDRAIYTQVGSWLSLRPSHVVTALLGVNQSVLRAEPFERPAPGVLTRRISMPPAAYARLVAHVRATLARGPDGRPIVLDDGRYPGDAFYLARGSFSPWTTCNEWVRVGLAAAGVRVPLWSPFDRSLFWQLGE